MSFFVLLIAALCATAGSIKYLTIVTSLIVTGRKCKKLTRLWIVVFESTVYPGVTEDICVPILENNSGLKYREDFKVGYSPERINPGDTEHTLRSITKIVSGCDQQSLQAIADVYSLVVDAGVYQAESIKVAEAAKVIENTQRDLNIALMNDLAILFHQLDIDTLEVLEAAGTKWNFLPFRPGLVGGHCIGVDPYYLTCKAEMVGHHPEVILAGRHINDRMGLYIARETIKKMLSLDHHVTRSKVIVLGLTFKENCPDLRNSKVVDIINELKTFQVDVYVHDPIGDPAIALHEYGIKLCSWNELPNADAVILAVSHKEYLKKSLDDYKKKMNEYACLIDVKSVFDVKELEKNKISYWRL